MSESLIVRQENIAAIVQSAPAAFSSNSLSRERCLSAGQLLLDQVKHSGMTDELDQAIAAYIEKSKRTIKKMNDSRSPVTKLFDTIRAEFTAMESAVDPAKAGSIPFQLQQLRNDFAAKKRAAEERRRREEMERQRVLLEKKNYMLAVEDCFKQQFGALVSEAANELNRISDSLTLENYAEVESKLKGFSLDFSPLASSMRCTARVPVCGMSVEEIQSVQKQALQALLPQFAEQYRWEGESTRDSLLDLLPSRRRELERLAKASAEEAERLRLQMEQRKAAEAQRLQQERAQREAAEAQQRQLQMQPQGADLFAAAATEQEYQPKTKVTKRVQAANADGVLQILSFWWTKEGCQLSPEEAQKKLKFAFSLADKLANAASPELISHPSVSYVDEVKAK